MTAERAFMEKRKLLNTPMEAALLKAMILLYALKEMALLSIWDAGALPQAVIKESLKSSLAAEKGD